MTNPSILAAFERMWHHITNALSTKSDVAHTHDDLYYTESEVDAKITAVNTSITDIKEGNIIVKEAEHAVSADSATTATSATKATQDASGNVITATYETKADAATKLAEAKNYANSIKNDLLNGAGAAYDTLKELGDLIDENQDAINALERIASNKADTDHLHDDRYYTQEQIDSMEFITTDDINEICGTTIYMASEVEF